MMIVNIKIKKIILEMLYLLAVVSTSQGQLISEK